MLQALLAALLFGVSAPIAKVLLGEVDPITLAAFLYLGCGIGLLLLKNVQRLSGQVDETEARVNKSDMVWLVGAILAGGVAAPIVLMFSLRETPAAAASLLLNFESVATTFIATLVFKEAVSRRAWWAILSVTAASILLSLDLNGEWGVSIGAIGVLAACVLWGIDNNFTRNISAKDPVAVVTIKGLGAGAFSLTLALVLGSPFPGLASALGAMLLGSMSYGVSIVLFVRAMRGLGAARTSALFGTAPLAGVAVSFLLFQDAPTRMFIVALSLMTVGTILLLSEHHSHLHTHEPIAHEHHHRHDDAHHTHEHLEGISPGQSHSHWHEHPWSQHEHPHLPDNHHRHSHSKEA
jgi:drug/metabolite transporter (DMT)-like permease